MTVARPPEPCPQTTEPAIPDAVGRHYWQQLSDIPMAQSVRLGIGLLVLQARFGGKAQLPRRLLRLAPAPSCARRGRVRLGGQPERPGADFWGGGRREPRRWPGSSSSLTMG